MLAIAAKYIQEFVSFCFSTEFKLNKIQPFFLQKLITNLSEATSIGILQYALSKKKNN